MLVNIPAYPNFRKLDIEDKSAFQSVTSRLAPYLECSFLEIYAWNQRRNPTLVSALNGNLILRIDDFLRDVYTTTFIGRRELFDTITKLVDDNGSISNIHEPIIKNMKSLLRKSKYSYAIETDKVDYLINTSGFRLLKGGNFENFRRLVRKFETNYPNTTIEQLDLSSADDFGDVINLFKRWGSASNTIKDFQLQSGIDCLKTLLSSHSKFNEIEVLLLKSGHKLIGFSINEKCKKHFALGHFLIADKLYKGSFEKLIWEVVVFYNNNHFETLNIGYDLGIDSLRATKSKIFDKLYRKYRITKA